MKNLYTGLQMIPLFSQIEECEIERLLTCLSAKNKSYKKKEFIFIAGEAVPEVGVVLSGSVSVIKEDFWGNRAILAKMGPGELFGEAFSCAQTDKLPVSVVANEKSEILFINFKKIATVCSSVCVFHSQLISNMLNILSNKNIMLTQKMEHIVKRTTKEKLLSYLSAQAVKSSSSTFETPFNRQELADYLSVDRSAMSNELCKLRDEGILEFHKNQFTLK